MSQQTDSLLFELLEKPITVAIYGGGFKPPTKGHFGVAQEILRQFPEIDELKIFVGKGVRDGITQEESVQIWNIYKNYLGDKVQIEPVVSPVKDILRYARKNPEEKVYWVLGAREGDEDDIKGIENRTKTVEKYPNLEVKIITTLGGVSGTKTRMAIASGDQEQFYQLIPDIEEKQQIWDLLKDSTLNEISVNDIKSKIKDFISAAKQQSGDAKKAFTMLIKAAKGEIELTDEDKEFIKLQLTDILKAIFGAAIFALPAGSLVLVLLKALKLSSIVTPTAFAESVTPDELEQADAYADKQLAPIDVDLTSQHILDRLTGRESDVTFAQLIGFFKRLGKRKKEFTDFFSKYKEIVATDDKTNLNIPFVNTVNKAIAKTIMRKDDFLTSSPKLVFEGRYDTIVRNVVRDIMEEWKYQYDEGENKLVLKEDYDTTNTKGQRIRFQLHAELNIRETKYGIYRVDGGADPTREKPYLEVIFQVDPRDLPQKWEEIYMDLIDVVRHEVEHMTQQGPNVVASTTTYKNEKGEEITRVDSKEMVDDEFLRNLIKLKFLPKSDYYKLEQEVDAMLQGMYLKAKKSRTPFKDVINTYFDKARVAQKDRKDILDLWKQRAKALSLPLNEGVWSKSAFANMNRKSRDYRYFLTNENGDVIQDNLKTMSSVKKVLDMSRRWDGTFPGYGVPNIINVHDLQKDGEVVEQWDWGGKYGSPRLPNDIDPQYIKYNPENLNEIGDASAKVYPYKAIDSPEGLIAKANEFFSTPRSDMYFYEKVTYVFDTDKAKYVVNFHPYLKKQTYPNFNNDPNFKPGPPYKTTVSVGFTTIGNPEEEATNLNEQFSVLSTITNIVLDFVERLNKAGGNIVSLQVPPKEDTGRDSKIDSKRGKLYAAYIKKNLSRIPNYSTRERTNDKGQEYIEIYKSNNLNEVGEASTTPYKWSEEYNDDMGVEVSFETESGIEYNVMLQHNFYKNIPILDVEFVAGVIDPNFGGGMSSKVITNKGELFRVMSTVVDIIKFYVKNTNAKGVTYSPSKKGDETISTNQRNTLYKAFLTKQVPGVEFKQDSDYVVALFPGYVDLDETIKKVDGKYAVYPEKGGKRLGTHKTKAAAKKQLQAIHIQQQKESKDPFGLNELARDFVKEVFEETWNPKESFVSLCKYMKDNGMNISPLPKIKVIDNDEKNASNLLGKTAYYDPNNKSITLYTLGRHPKDILRSFAHEMVHHEQNLDGTLGNITTTNTNEDGNLAKLEKEAYLKGNMMLRNWEDGIKAEKYLKEYKQYALNELFEKDLPNIEKLSPTEYIVGNGDDIEAKYYFRLDEPDLNKWSIHWLFTDNNKNTTPDAWKQVTTTSFKVLKDFINTKKPTFITISGNESKSGKNAKLNIYKSNSFLKKLENIFNNQYLIKNDNEDFVLMKSIEEAYKHSINESVKYGGEKYEDALHYWQNLDINSKSKIERWSAIKRKIEREVLHEIYDLKPVTLDIPKFNYKKTLEENLWHTLNEISLNPNNAAEIEGSLVRGNFQAGDKVYTYSISPIASPYNDKKEFWNIGFYPEDNYTSSPTGDSTKEDYIKILNTMYKVILRFAEEYKPYYIGISSFDNSSNKNYHRIYNNLTDNRFNNIPGYFRKDANLKFDIPQGTGRFIVLKRKDV